MGKFIEGKLDGKGLKFDIIVSRFNEFITSKLTDGAIDCLTRHNVDEKSIRIFRVPGSFEIPYLAAKLAEKKQADAIICLGTIIKGGTDHYAYIAAEVTKGIAMTALKSGMPVILGVLTTDNIEQAIERSGTKAGNKGWDAALNAIEMANLYKSIK